MTPHASRASQVLARLADQRPEWWALVLAVAAWVAMLPHLLSASPSGHPISFWDGWRAWTLMVIAMTVPLILESVRWAAERSLRSRQLRAMMGYLVGHLAPWVVFGAVVAWTHRAPWAHLPWLPSLAFGLAAVWALTPLYPRLVGWSHRTLPLAPKGWAADRDCLRFGFAQGVPCLGGCWLLMVGCTLTGHGPVAMVGGTLLSAAERMSWQPRPWVVPLGCAALAVWYGLAWLS